MIEPEMAFATLEENIRLQEDMVKYLIDAVLTEAPEEMEFLKRLCGQGLN